MPKIIEGVREKVLDAAKRRLFEKGYQHMSLRAVAAESGIGLGTIYNYFENKDYLIAGIMMEDWTNALRKMDVCVEEAGSISEGILGICEALEEFRAIYNPVWRQPSVAATATGNAHKGHSMLCRQIEERADALFGKWEEDREKRFPSLIAELIIAASASEEIKAELKRMTTIFYEK